MIERFLERVEFDDYEDFKRNYRLRIPENFNFAYDVADAWARQCPDKPALVWTDGADREKRFTFADVKRASDKAARLFHDRGIAKGDAVLLMMKQRPEAWFLLLGLHKLGAVAIPATWQLAPKDIVYRVNAASAKMICCADDPEMADRVDAALPDCPDLRHAGILGPPNRPGWFDLSAELEKADADWTRPTDPDRRAGRSDPMLIYFSSGTTGMPKMILHDHDYPLGHIVTAKYWQQVEDGGLHLTVADSGWAKFAWSKIYGQWICGAVIVAYDADKFRPAHLLKTMERLRLASFCAPPTVYRFLIQEDPSGYDLSTLRQALTAGEPLSPEVHARFLAATGLSIREGFGQSETSVLLANFPGFPVKPGSMGKPSPLYDLDLVGDDGRSCEDGIVGTIVVKNTDREHPAGLFREYYRDPEAMAQSWTGGCYSTGDMAWRDAEGYYWFVGRNDDLIKCSGYRIGPFEVESALASHPAVLESAVTAAPDPLRGQVVKATVVLSPGREGSEALKTELREHVKRVTAPYKYPRLIEFVDELPKTTSGKIRRAEIRGRGERTGGSDG